MRQEIFKKKHVCVCVMCLGINEHGHDKSAQEAAHHPALLIPDGHETWPPGTRPSPFTQWHRRSARNVGCGPW